MNPETGEKDDQSLAAQEDVKIRGNEARNILMHKLMRRNEVRRSIELVNVNVFNSLFL